MKKIITAAALLIAGCSTQKKIITGKYVISKKNTDGSVCIKGYKPHFNFRNDTLKVGDTISIIVITDRLRPQRF
jgi:hypothetical protein